jgi:hypothetical protein
MSRIYWAGRKLAADMRGRTPAATKRMEFHNWRDQTEMIKFLMWKMIMRN